jgi:hypothetical protein
MSHFQVMLLAKSYPHKYTKIPKVFAICIEKYRFLVFINCDMERKLERH